MRLSGIAAPSKQSRHLVLQVLSKSGPLPLRDLYQTVLRQPFVPELQQRPTPPPTPGNRPPKEDTALKVPEGHPVRSRSYLKHSVLGFLTRRDFIQKIRLTRTLTPAERERLLRELQAKMGAKQAATKLASRGDVVKLWVWQLTKKAPERPQLFQTMYQKPTGASTKA